MYRRARPCALSFARAHRFGHYLLRKLGVGLIRPKDHIFQLYSPMKGFALKPHIHSESSIEGDALWQFNRREVYVGFAIDSLLKKIIIDSYYPTA